MIRIQRAFTSVLFIGWIPGAPGTYASLITLPLAYYWSRLVGDQVLWTMALIIVLAILGSLSSTRVAKHIGIEDPSEIVIDEVVGQWIALLAVPLVWGYWLAAFVLFRIFDIWKPWLIDRVQHLPGGPGIMLDDVLAGFLSFLIIQVVANIL